MLYHFWTTVLTDVFHRKYVIRVIREYKVVQNSNSKTKVK